MERKGGDEIMRDMHAHSWKMAKRRYLLLTI